MPVKGSRRRKLAELVPDHVLGHQHRDELAAIVDAESESHELRKDRRPARPCPDDLVASGVARLLRFFKQITVDKRPFPNRACHALSPSYEYELTLVPTADDQPVGRLVVPCLLAFGRLAPRRDRMATARSATLAAAMRVVDPVHRHSSYRLPMTQPTVAPRLAAADVL